MNICFYPSRFRKSTALLFMALGCYVGFVILGDAGFGLALLASRVAWQRQAWRQLVTFIASGELVHYWQSPFAIAFKFRDLDWQWVYCDEVGAEDFAALRRYAKLTLLRQPVGLSISK